ncbi:MAG: hypothetical protein AAGF26_07225, partial [Cyanobacteria bacterium P01_G01_bin.49]
REKTNKNLMEKYLSKIIDNQCNQGSNSNINNICSRQDVESITKDLLKNGEGVFSSIFTVHERDKNTDPFLEVEHDAFYKCRSDAEF